MKWYSEHILYNSRIVTNIVHLIVPDTSTSTHVTVVPLSDRSRTKFRVEVAGAVFRVYTPVKWPFVIVSLVSWTSELKPICSRSPGGRMSHRISVVVIVQVKVTFVLATVNVLSISSQSRFCTCVFTA